GVNVSVVSPTLLSLTVTPSNVTVTVGATQQYTATGTYSDLSTQNLTGEVTWSSSNTAAATINPDGVASAGGPGSTTISATLGSTTGSTGLTVQAGPLTIMTASLPAGQVGVSYAATLQALGGMPPYTWSLASGTFPAGLTLSANTGVISGTPTAAGTSSFTVQVSDGSDGGNSTTKALSITVNAAAQTIWPSTAVATNPDGEPNAKLEVVVKFRSDVAGVVTRVRFYKHPLNTGTHIGNLWATDGTRLATATFTGETASGWQQVNFTTPVAITANTVYVASYFVPVGHYSGDKNYFATQGVDNPPLHALATGSPAGTGASTYAPP